MKKTICLILAVIFILGLSACGSTPYATDGDAGYYATDGDAGYEWQEEVNYENFGTYQPDDLLEGKSDLNYPDFAELEQKEVSSTDEFLAALKDDTAIILKDGDYDLSDASDYGTYYQEGPYTWLDLYDGTYELEIRGLRNLTICGNTDDSSAVKLMVKPRYANVITFSNCECMNFVSLTSGHTEAPGFCTGGVWNFEACRDINVFGCRLYGCGTLGVSCTNCRNIGVRYTDIYDCSNGAAYLYNCFDVRFENSRFSGCGVSTGGGYSMFYAVSTTGLAFVNCKAEQNICQKMYELYSCEEVYLLGSEFADNDITYTFFELGETAPIIDKCSFKDEAPLFYAAYSDEEDEPYGLSPAGDKLTEDELREMKLSEAKYEGPAAQEEIVPSAMPEEPAEEYHVSTADEFLEAIGPNRTIYVETELLDLSSASNYGGYSSGDYYTWEQVYDGPNLVITGVSNLRIKGLGKDSTTLQAVPRYANVLTFRDCTNIVVSDLTAGHMKEAPGSCSGSVLGFSYCRNFYVLDCGLFGCGVYGLDVTGCTKGSVVYTEIYDCSDGAASLYSSNGIVFTNCDIHDCGENGDGILVNSCGDCMVNDIPLAD